MKINSLVLTLGVLLLAACSRPMRVTYSILTAQSWYHCLDISKINSIVITMAGPSGMQTKVFSNSDIASGKVTGDWDMMPLGTYSVSGIALDASGSKVADSQTVSFTDTSNGEYFLQGPNSCR